MNRSAYVTTVSSVHSNISDDNEKLAQELNDEMTRAVLPVTVFVGIEIFAAFFGNLLVIYIFLFRYHDCNFRYFVLCLAFTDITSSLTTMPGEMLTQLYWYVYPVPEICKIKSFFNVFTVSSEALCLLTIGFDRYLKVCRPLARQIKPKHAKYVCGIIYFIAFVLALPVYFYWGTHTSQKVYKNTTITVTVCEKDEKWLHTNHPLQYSVTLEVIISLCLIFMFGLYVFIARKLLQNKGVRFRAYTRRQKYPMSSADTSSNPIETNSTQEVNESGDSSKNGRKVRNSMQTPTKRTMAIDKQTPKIRDEGTDDENISDNEGKSESRHESLYARTTDDKQDAPTKKSEIKTRSRVKSHDKPSTSRNSEHGHNLASRVRRKTLIMFILTVVFIFTTILYLTLLSYIAESILDTMSDSNKAVYFFFFRLYFINHAINPIVYGILDPHFRKVLTNIKMAISTTGTDAST